MHHIASLIDSLEKSCAGDGVRSDDPVRLLSICLDKLTAAAQEAVPEFDDTDYAEMVLYDSPSWLIALNLKGVVLGRVALTCPD